MTQTPNIGLKKIDGSENWRSVFDYHNDSMDLADEAIAGVRAGLTYVENGDTIAANASYTTGKFIAWKGEIYRVKATINATVTSANWTTYLDKMDGIGGALSQINGDLASLNSKLTPAVVAVQPFGQWTDYTGGYYVIGNMVVVQITAIAGNFGANDYFTMVNSLPTPASASSLSITTTSDNYKGAEAYVGVDGKLVVKSGANSLTGQRVVATGIYIKA